MTILTITAKPVARALRRHLSASLEAARPAPCRAARPACQVAAAAWVCLFLWLASSIIGAISPARAAGGDYSSLKKFLNARMYSEAYLELLRNELLNDQEDPKLTKLKKDLLPRTERDLAKRIRISPDDATLHLIMADIHFQQGNLEKAISSMTKAQGNESGALGPYTFAKILFAKGNIPQSFTEMEKALQADPTSTTIFNDFQFLYNCKNYGVSSALRLTGNNTFLKRATPVAGQLPKDSPVENPYDNDPTMAPVVTRPADPVTSPDPTTPPDQPPDPLDGIDDPPPPDSTPDQPTPDPDAQPGPDNQPDPDDQPDLPDPTPTPTDPVGKVPDLPAEDPEQARIKEGERYFKQAQQKFEFGDYIGAEQTLQDARKKYGDELPGEKELQAKIDERKSIDQLYKGALRLYEEKKFELALRDFQRAYDYNPEKFKEATFYLGKLYYLVDSERDLPSARKYFDLFLQMPDIDARLKRDVDWLMICILAEEENFEEAAARFDDFVEREPDYAKNQAVFKTLKYKLWYQTYKVYILAGFGIFVSLFFLVFALHLFQPLISLLSDPVKRAQAAFDSGNYAKAVKLAEGVLTGKKQPLQIERQLLEICIQAHFSLKNFVRCQDHARELLAKFADNLVAWKYLAKSRLETKDATEEAITMYETLYEQNPEQKELLPLMAAHYAKKKQFTVQAMAIMFAYYESDPANVANILALAEGYVQNKQMGDEVVDILESALRHAPDNISFHELLARNYSKRGQFAEAVRECLVVLQKNINNMGIHVVYTSCMKKLNMLDEAILQYEEFQRHHPDNPQITEILQGMRKEIEQTSDLHSSFSAPDELSPFNDELVTDGLHGFAPGSSAPQQDMDINGFVEPPPDGFSMPEDGVPIPDFMKSEPGEATDDGTTGFDDLNVMPTLDPFNAAGNDLAELSPFTDFGAETPEPPPPPKAATTSPATPFKAPAAPPPPVSPPPAAPPLSERSPTPPRPATGTGKKPLDEAREYANAGNWALVVSILSPEFASRRTRDVGVLLADGYLRTHQPETAQGILETLEFDRELMPENLKDIFYRVGVALEEKGLTSEALNLYHLICNADINFRDTFDRSERLYQIQQKG